MSELTRLVQSSFIVFMFILYGSSFWLDDKNVTVCSMRLQLIALLIIHYQKHNSLVMSSNAPVTIQPQDVSSSKLQNTTYCQSWIFCCRRPSKEVVQNPGPIEDELEVDQKCVGPLQSAVPKILIDDLNDGCEDNNSEVSMDTDISDFIRGYGLTRKEEHSWLKTCESN